MAWLYESTDKPAMIGEVIGSLVAISITVSLLYILFRQFIG